MDSIRFFLTADDDDDAAHLAGTCCQLDNCTMRVELARDDGATHTLLLPAALSFAEIHARIRAHLAA